MPYNQLLIFIGLYITQLITSEAESASKELAVPPFPISRCIIDHALSDFRVVGLPSISHSSHRSNDGTQL
jgi:hypothetical protein